MKLCLSEHRSPVGDFTLVTRGETLCVAQFSDHAEGSLRALPGRYPDLPLERGAAPGAVAKAFEAYWSGALRALSPLAVEAGGTAFQARIWAELREDRREHHEGAAGGAPHRAGEGEGSQLVGGGFSRVIAGLGDATDVAVRVDDALLRERDAAHRSSEHEPREAKAPALDHGFTSRTISRRSPRGARRRARLAAR